MDEKTKEKLIISTMLLTMENIIARLDHVCTRFEELIDKNEKVFKLAGENFTRRIIEGEIKKQTDKDKKALRYKNKRSGQSG